MSETQRSAYAFFVLSAFSQSTKSATLNTTPLINSRVSSLALTKIIELTYKIVRQMPVRDFVFLFLISAVTALIAGKKLTEIVAIYKATGTDCRPKNRSPFSEKYGSDG